MKEGGTCKGSYVLGTACGHCSRCRNEAIMQGGVAAAQIGFKDTNTDKWIGKEADFNHALASVRLSLKEYSRNIFDNRDDITRREAADEFWQRVAEAEGFTINFNRES